MEEDHKKFMADLWEKNQAFYNRMTEVACAQNMAWAVNKEFKLGLAQSFNVAREFVKTVKD